VKVYLFRIEGWNFGGGFLRPQIINFLLSVWIPLTFAGPSNYPNLDHRLSFSQIVNCCAIQKAKFSSAICIRSHSIIHRNLANELFSTTCDQNVPKNFNLASFFYKLKFPRNEWDFENEFSWFRQSIAENFNPKISFILEGIANYKCGCQ
jgi:hypothetical protein